MTRQALEMRDQYDQLLGSARVLVEEARRCGLRPPDFLVELISGLEGPSDDVAGVVPMMKPPTARPLGVPDGAIWIDASHPAVQARTMALAILAGEGQAMAPADIYDRYCEHREVNKGSLANAGTNLQRQGLITRDGRHGGSGWEVTDPGSAPILKEGYVWSLPESLGTTEVAWYRRMAIQHIIRTLGGQQQMQIVHHLGQMPWVPGRKEKDTVKADLEALREEGLVHRIGHSKKWELSKKEGSQ